MSNQFITMEIKGIAKDAHANFPIKFEYSEGGVAYFIGCRMEAEVELSNGKSFTNRMDIRAFGEVAEALAHVSDGVEIYVKGDYGQQQSKKDNKWYPILTVTEVIEA